MTEKRSDYIAWDEYFMGVAKLAANRSKDPSTQVGACIVNSDNMIVSVGYNGLPAGCSDDDFPWAREGETFDTKYAYVCHAELNAILNSGTGDLRGTRIYVTLFPCEGCTKALIQKGIKEVIYDSDKYHDMPGTMAARRMLDAAGVKYTKYVPTGRRIELDV
ncbi:MAG: dCMP deaminase family protein [Clostridiales bacterium]|nr:dCMP deaminase family protein [Clostridiales bacterium]